MERARLSIQKFHLEQSWSLGRGSVLYGLGADSSLLTVSSGTEGPVGDLVSVSHPQYILAIRGSKSLFSAAQRPGVSLLVSSRGFRYVFTSAANPTVFVFDGYHELVAPMVEYSLLLEPIRS